MFRTVLTPLNKLLKRKDREEDLFDEFEGEAEEGEIVTVFEDTEPAAGSPASEEIRREEAVSTADFNRIVNPLEILAAMEVPALRDNLFEEKPVQLFCFLRNIGC